MTPQLRFGAGWLQQLSVWTLGTSLLACGAADGSRTARAEPPDDAGFSSTINTCPSFVFYLVLPQNIRGAEKASITVFATDADSEDTQLSYTWSATAGEFSEPHSFLTEYACAGTGPQLLSVIAADPDGCGSPLHLDVTCEAE